MAWYQYDPFILLKQKKIPVTCHETIWSYDINSLKHKNEGTDSMLPNYMTL